MPAKAVALSLLVLLCVGALSGEPMPQQVDADSGRILQSCICHACSGILPVQCMLKSRNVVKLETQIVGLAALGLTIPVYCSPSPVHG